MAENHFMRLPTEVHLLIAKELPYPDLMSLKLTHPKFANGLVHTSKTHRVDWLIDRAFQKLTLPMQSRCRWSSDREFLSNAEVLDILQKRRKHIECAEMAAHKDFQGRCLVTGESRCSRLEQARAAMGNAGTMKSRFQKRTLRRCRETKTYWHVAAGVLIAAIIIWAVKALNASCSKLIQDLRRNRQC